MNSEQRYLPNGWKWVKLGQKGVFRVVSGGTPKSGVQEYWDGEVPWITLVDLPQDNFITEITNTHRTISDEGLQNSSAKLIPADSIVVSSRATIGRIGINRVPLATNQGFKNIVIEDESQAIPEYVAFALTKIVPVMLAQASGSTYKEITKTRFSELQIPLPPLEEQKRLTAVLDERMAMVESARKAAHEMIDAVDSLKNAILRELLPYLGQQLAAGWKWVALKEICIRHKNMDPRQKPNNHFIYIDISSIDRSTKTILNPSVIIGKDAPSRARRIINKGDVLVSTTRPNLNSIAMVDDELDGQICSTGLCVLRPQKHLVISRWLYYCTMNREFVNSLSSLVSGAMYPAVTDKQVFQQLIPLPPLEEQKRITKTISKRMEVQEYAKAAALQQLDAIESLRPALLRQAFSGAI